jgi:competence protein ComEC
LARRSLILFAGVGVLIMAAVAGLLSRAPVAPAATPALTAEIRFVDVGQGDGVVMRIGNKIIVSDTGELRYPVLKKALKEDLKATRIDVLILSHAHSDHAKSAARLLREWKVGRVVMNESLWWNGPDTNKAVMKAIRDEPNLTRIHPVAGKKYDWGGAEWTFAHPRSGELLGFSSGAAGSASLVYLLRVNGVTALFTGDITEQVGNRLAEPLKQELEGERVDIFLMTHHGATSSSSETLNKAVRPRSVVISAGARNQFDHPLAGAVNSLKAIPVARIWCTPANGTVTARINAAGRLSWASEKLAGKPWWSGGVRRGACNKL